MRTVGEFVVILGPDDDLPSDVEEVRGVTLGPLLIEHDRAEE